MKNNNTNHPVGPKVHDSREEAFSPMYDTLAQKESYPIYQPKNLPLCNGGNGEEGLDCQSKKNFMKNNNTNHPVGPNVHDSREEAFSPMYDTLA